MVLAVGVNGADEIPVVGRDAIIDIVMRILITAARRVVGEHPPHRNGAIRG